MTEGLKNSCIPQSETRWRVPDWGIIPEVRKLPEWGKRCAETMKCLWDLRWELSVCKDVMVWFTAKETQFDNKYAPVISVLCQKYNIPANHFLSLIERESWFGDQFQMNKEKSATDKTKKRKYKEKFRGSSGFTQLTNPVFEDMKAKTKNTPGGRAQDYISAIEKAIGDPDLLKIIGTGKNEKAFWKVCQLLQSSIHDGKVTDKSLYNKAISGLALLSQYDQKVNMLVSSVFQDSLQSRIKKNIDKPSYNAQCIRILRMSTQLDYAILASMLKAHESESSRKLNPDAVKQHCREVISAMKQDQDAYNSFLWLFQYNGNTKPEAWGIPHQMYYAMAISIREKIRNTH